MHSSEPRNLPVLDHRVAQQRFGDLLEFGIVDVDGRDNIVGFREKPPVDADAERTDSAHDFGKDVLPRMVASSATVVAYDFSTNTIPDMHDGQRGYWRDVGSIDMYWRTSEDLISITPQLNLYNPRWPMLSAYYPHPPAKFVFDLEDRRGAAIDSMVSGGCIVSGSTSSMLTMP